MSGSPNLGAFAIVCSLVFAGGAIAALRSRNGSGKRRWYLAAMCAAPISVSAYYAVLELSPHTSYFVDTEVVAMYREPIFRSNDHTFWFIGLDGHHHQVSRDLWVSMRYGTRVRCRGTVVRTFFSEAVGPCEPLRAGPSLQSK